MSSESAQPEDSRSQSACPECGAAVEGGLAGCQALFEELLAREFGDYRYAAKHRTTVDAYALQHPDQYMRSAKSYAAHLTGLTAAIESENPRVLHAVVQQWLSGRVALERPGQPPAGARGELTILHVLAAPTPAEHLARVQQWAQSTWRAWSSFHPLAASWMEQASHRRG